MFCSSVRAAGLVSWQLVAMPLFHNRGCAPEFRILLARPHGCRLQCTGVLLVSLVNKVSWENAVRVYVTCAGRWLCFVLSRAISIVGDSDSLPCGSIGAARCGFHLLTHTQTEYF